MKKRILAIILILAMAISSLPAWADELDVPVAESNEISTEETVEDTYPVETMSFEEQAGEAESVGDIEETIIESVTESFEEQTEEMETLESDNETESETSKETDEPEGVNTNNRIVSEDQVINKLNSLISSYAGTYWTTDGQPADKTGTTSKKHKGIQSKGFANFVFNELFGVWDIGEISDEGYYIPSPDGAQEIGRLQTVSVDNTDELAKLFAQGRPGDFIQTIRRDNGAKHSMILVSVDENGIEVFDCNSDGQCYINELELAWKEITDRCTALSIYRAANYEVKSVVELEIDAEEEESIEAEEEENPVFEAPSQAAVSSRLNSLMAQYVGKSGTWSFAGGSQCYGFAHMIFNDIFGRGNAQVGNGAVSSNTTCYRLNNVANDIITLGTLNPGYSASSLEELLEKAAPGDYVQVRRNYSPYNPHSMIVVSVNRNDNIIEIFDANTDGKGTVKHYTQDFNTFKSKNQGVSIYRYSSYSPDVPSSSKPTNVSLSGNQGWWDIKDTITLTPYSSGADYYWISITKDGENVYNKQITGPVSISASSLGYGNYKAWISAVNSVGYTDSSEIDISIVGKPSYEDVWASSPVYDLDDTVTIDVRTICAKGQVIGIDKDGVGRIYTGATGLTYTVSAKSLGKGSYSAYFTVNNGSGSIDTKRVYFVIAERADLGDQFFARIKNPASNKYITQVNNNVKGESLDCEKYQKWLFVRLDDGSYKIINSKSYDAMDITDYGNAGLGTNVQLNTNWNTTAQRFYIQEAYGAYYLKPICCSMFVDMSQSGENNVEVWGGGVDWGPQKFEIIKVSEGHTWNHEYSSKVTKAATCTADGIRTYTCSVCDKSYTEAITKTAHTYSTNWTIDKTATCTATGSKSHHCTVCGTKKDVTTTPMTAHKYMSEVTKAATCTAEGIRTYTCSACGKFYTEAIARTAHTYSTSWTIDKVATCTAAGSKSHHCTGCGAKTDVTSIPMMAHKYDAGVVTKAPTTTANGVKKYTCEVCKATKTEDIPRLFLVIYNVNGGSGGPSSQTKTYGIALTLAATKPVKSYKLTYNANGGIVSSPTKIVSCAFKNWNTKSDGTGTVYAVGSSYTTDADATLYAQWTNPTMGILAVPTRSGYSFDGWYTSISGGAKVTPNATITGNMTVYAHWTVNKYTVTYNSNGDSGVPAAQTKIYGTALTLSTAKPIKSYTITYNANGGSISSKTKSVSAAFKNWNTQADGKGTSYAAGANYTKDEAVTLYAQWTNPQAGTLATPIRSGYIFDGWYTAASGGSKVTSGTTITKNTTLYAHWTKISVTGVKLNKTNAELTEKGATISLTATVSPDDAADKNVTWTSSNAKVATVNSKGVVTAAANGTATITVKTTDGGKTAACKITVKIPAPEETKPTTPEYKDDVEAFAAQLYKVCLGRNPDSEGLDTWATRLKNKQETGVSAAYGFVFSNEFKAKNLCNEDYVEQLYAAFMGRKADASGKSTWVNLLESGTTREEVFNGFALSKEFASLCKQYGIEQGSGIEIPKFGTLPTGPCGICGKEDGVTGFVTRLYQVCLNRKPDAGGLKDWRTRLCEHTSSGREVAYGFIFSQEFIGKKYSDADYVEYLYEAFMGRSSDAVGKAMWVDYLKKGWSREQVFDGFVGSQEFTKICNSYGIVRD